MEIVDDLLVSDEEFQVQFEETRNAGPEMVKLKYLVIHYTAGLNFQAAIDTFRNEEGPRRVSSHIVIGRNGEIVQMVPFNEQAWHSGGSYWEGDFLLNQYSIGIELDNEGKLIHHNGQWTFKRKYAIPENEYQISEYWKEYGQVAWKVYPEIQLRAAEAVCQAIADHYPLTEVLGHDQIHEGKPDPGPLFPMKSFRHQLLGREDYDYTEFRRYKNTLLCRCRDTISILYP